LKFNTLQNIAIDKYIKEKSTYISKDYPKITVDGEQTADNSYYL